MSGSIGMPEVVLISVIALIVFGPANSSEFGKFLGEAIRGFSKPINDPDKSIERSASPITNNERVFLNGKFRSTSE
jgi:sec-independent protein translocase protein TatA